MDPGAGGDDDGSLAGLPWASVFDPATNVKALGEIQARGLRAAGDVVDRLVRMVDGDGSTPTDPPLFGAEPGAAEASEIDRLVRSWESLLGQLVASFGDGDRNGNGTAPGIDLAPGGPGGSGEPGASGGALRGVAPGPGPTGTEVWLHNRGPDELDTVRLRCSELLAHDGRVIPAGVVRFEPEEISSMPRRSSRAVDLIIDVPADALAGRYRGTLLADGHPDAWLPVELVVRTAAP